MFCRNCGSPMNNQAVVCVSCGVPIGKGNNFCPNCGDSTNPMAQVCVKCGVNLQFSYNNGAVAGQKSKLAAGLLGIFLGYFGVHRFYLGFVGIGIAQIAVTLVTCGLGGIWGFIEGILILTGNINKDANGNPLGE
jgi:TM2 domain-containing membrane protein YozV